MVKHSTVTFNANKSFTQRLNHFRRKGIQTLYQKGFKHCNNFFVQRTVTSNRCQKCIMPASILLFIGEITSKSEKLLLTFPSGSQLCRCVIVQNPFHMLANLNAFSFNFNNSDCWSTYISMSLESLSMTFTADGKRQRLPLIFYSFLAVIKSHKNRKVSYYSRQIQIFWFYCTESWRQTVKV